MEIEIHKLSEDNHIKLWNKEKEQKGQITSQKAKH